MTPHDELMALAGKWNLRSDPHSGKCAADLRALLDSDAFRAMARNDARYRCLRRHLVNWCPDDGTASLSWYAREALDESIDAAASGAGEGEP